MVLKISGDLYLSAVVDRLHLLGRLLVQTTLVIMLSNARFRISDKDVVHELVEGEVLAINLESGTYYSMPGISAQIWLALVSGTSLEAVVGSLVEAYEGERAIIESTVAQFFEKLKSERLIVSDAVAADAAVFPAASNRQKLPFAEPVVEIYTDMQDLLLLDPIHDVDEAGWPVLKPNTPEAKN